MGFSLKGAIGGLARGGSSILDSKKKEEDEQRERVDTNIFSTTGLLFEKADQQKKVRQAEIKANKEFSNLLISKDSSMAKDPAKMAYALSLPKTARDDLLALADSSIFQTNNIPLADYFDAIDDPIEYKDPVTLTERVMGKVVDRPLESSKYYGVSTTEDEEVDKIVAGYAGGFATAYGMSTSRAQGLLDSATQEVKMQRFTINWANKKRQSAQADAENVAKIALVGLNTEKSNQQLATLLETQNAKTVTKAFTAFANSLGIPPTAHAADPTLPAKFKASKAFGQARENVIKQMARDMIENPTRSLDRSTTLFFSREYPGYWGGNANEIPENELVDAAYYEIESKGEVEILRGFKIKRLIAASGNSSKTGNKVSAQTDNMLSTKPISTDEITLNDEQLNAVDPAKDLEAASILQEASGEPRSGGLGSRADANSARDKRIVEGALSRVNKRAAEPDAPVEETEESTETPIRPLTPYQKVMMKEKRGTIGAAKAYDQAVDIAIQKGDRAAIIRVQSIIKALTGDDIGYGVPDMLTELTEKIESALKK